MSELQAKYHIKINDADPEGSSQDETNAIIHERVANGDWFYDNGGYMSIGYNAGAVRPAPTSFESLANPAYKGDVALDGNPTEAGAACAAVYAASLANGGSLAGITPGVTCFMNSDATRSLDMVAPGWQHRSWP